jgi:hypothetical protein
VTEPASNPTQDPSPSEPLAEASATAQDAVQAPQEQAAGVAQDADLLAALNEIERMPSGAVPSLEPEALGAPAAARTEKKNRFRVPAAPPADEPQRPASARGATRTAPDDELIVPTVTLGKRAYRLLDAVLTWLNRPFGWVPPGIRGALGVFGLTTLAVFLLALIIKPILMPSTDAFTFLEECLAKAQSPPEAPADAGHEAAGDAHAPAAPAPKH